MEKRDIGAKRGPTSIMDPSLKKPLATNHTQTHTYSEHSSRMLVLFLPHSMGKQPTCVSFTVCTTASRPGSCYSSKWLFFPVVCGNNGTQRPILHSDRGLLFLATARAAQDISQTFGCLWSTEPWVHLWGGGIFQSLLFGIRCILKWFIRSIPLDL